MLLRKPVGILLLGIILAGVLFGCTAGESAEIPADDEIILPEAQHGIGSPHYIALDDFEALFDTFVRPVISGVIGFSWDDPYEISPDRFVWMYGYVNVFPTGAVAYEDIDWQTGTFFDELEGEEREWRAPFYYRDALLLEQYIQYFFDVSAEHLRLSQWYNSERNAYRFNLGGIGSGPWTEIVRAEFDDQTNLLVIYMETDLGFADFGRSDMREIVTNRLTIKLREGGTGDTWILPVSGDFMFLSNESSRLYRDPVTGMEMIPAEPDVIMPDDIPVDMVELEYVGHITAGFFPDWEAITQRANELVEFFETNLPAGISLEDAKRELGVEPANILFDDTVRQYLYAFDLMTGPGYRPLLYRFHSSSPEIGINHEWLRAGYIGVQVVLHVPESEDDVLHLSIGHGDPYGAGSYNIMIFMFDEDVVVDVFLHSS